MRPFALALVATFGLVSHALGGDVNGTITNWTSPKPRAVVWIEGIPKPATSEPDAVMSQHNGQFVPSFLVVVAGQTVNMPNEDNIAHNVYSLSAAKKFDLGYYARGDLRSVTFDLPGVVDVHCLIHNFMRARILVVPTPFFATIAGDGTFHIRKVPPGAYRLTFWCDDVTFSQIVTVPEEGRTFAIRVSWPSAPGK